jgi:lipopolysaccharide export system protein LptA
MIRRSLGIAFGLSLLTAACRSPASKTRPAPARTGRNQAAADSARAAATADSLLAIDRLRVQQAAQQAALDSAKAVAKPNAAPVPDKPAERCVMDMLNTPETRSQSVRDPASGKYFTYIGGGVSGKCRSQDITVRSDSLESYDQTQLYILIGNAQYKEPRVTINAQRATYFRAEERVLMEGDVRAVMQNGAVMVAPRAEYFRAVRGIRERSKLVATVRPALSFAEKDSLGRPQPPTNLNANEITADGDSIFIASGKVILNRTDLVATGDSAYMDNGKQWSRLMKGPVIQSKSDQPFTLKGRVIDLYGSAKLVNRVIAIDSAKAISKDLELIADTLDLRVKDNKLERTYAFGPSGAAARTPDRDVVADSLDVVMPHQRIRELRAIRRAYAESDPDTATIVSDERDWLRGDTIIASFDSLPPNDTTSKPRIRGILASGEASAYYQVPSNSGVKDKPGVNYVRGSRIQLNFAAGDIDNVTVTERVSGVYLEASSDTTSQATKKRGRPKTATPQRRGTTGAQGRPAVRRPAGGTP